MNCFNKKYLLATFLMMTLASTDIYAQDSNIQEVVNGIERLEYSNIKRKNEINVIRSQLNNFEKNQTTTNRQEVIDSVQNRINKLEDTNSSIKQQLDVILSISNSTNSSVDTRLNTVSIVLGAVGIGLTIVAIFLGVYVNRKENRIVKLLDKSDENYRLQLASEKKTDAIRSQITSDLTSIYKNLKAEEVKDIFAKITNSPEQIRNHTSRLLTLDLEESHFIQLRGLYYTWAQQQEFRYYLDNIVLVLISHFPDTIAANQQLMPLFQRHFENILIRIPMEILKRFSKTQLNAYLQSDYEEAGSHLVEVIKALLSNFNGDYVAVDIFYNNIDEKSKRFQFFSLVEEIDNMPGADYSSSRFFGAYSDQLIKDYGDITQNSAVENEIIEKLTAT